MKKPNQTLFSKKEKFVFFLFLLFLFLSDFAEEYTKFKSTLKDTQCGKVINVYEKNIGRGIMPFFDLISHNNKTYKFAYASTGGMKLWFKSLVDVQAKDKLKLVENLRIGDKLCVTYSLKYQEGSILLARPDTPYIFTIELSNVTK